MTENTLPILVVEDNEMNQHLILRQLQRVGFAHVALVGNGVDALAWLEKNQCLLIIADCQMPLMDGYEMTRQIRVREKATGQHLHIIALTASVMDDDRERCAAAGMDGYISKPTQISNLQEILQKWLPTKSP
jgi:two-component system sensor histidine kinase/response regulator